MDRSSAPWRVLEAPDDEMPPAGRDGPPADPAAAGVGVLGIPVPWLVAGATAVMVTVALVGVMLAGSGTPIVRVAGSDPTTSDGPDPSGSGEVGAGSELVVEVAGAVAHPGLYRLVPGQRVADAIAAAGGYSPRVDAGRATAALNLAARIADGDRIMVPSRDDPSPPAGAGADGTAGGASTGSTGTGAVQGTGAGTGPVDLNRATSAELDALPGIGPVTAAKIIAAREERPFGSVDDLRTRKLVGPALFEKLRTLVVVR